VPREFPQRFGRGIVIGVLFEGGDACEAGVLSEGAGVAEPEAPEEEETGMPSADRVTAVRHAWIDPLSWSTVSGNPDASKSVPKSAPLLCR
jgi:hypothetical protein